MTWSPNFFFIISNKTYFSKKSNCQLPDSQNTVSKSFFDVTFTDFTSKGNWVIKQFTSGFDFLSKTYLMTVKENSQNSVTLPSIVLKILQKNTESSWLIFEPTVTIEFRLKNALDFYNLFKMDLHSWKLDYISEAWILIYSEKNEVFWLEIWWFIYSSVTLAYLTTYKICACDLKKLHPT